MYLTISELRSIINEQLILLEKQMQFVSDDEITKHYPYDAEAIIACLHDSGAEAIPRGVRQNIFLGHGTNGYVIDVIYQGKRCAMKITREAIDYDAYEKISLMYNDLPNFIKRHLPKIYTQGEVLLSENGKEENDYDEEDEENTSNVAYYTIMEILQPLPKGISLQGWGYDDNDHKLQRNLLQISLKKIKENLPSLLDRVIRKNIKSASFATKLSKELLDNTSLLTDISTVFDSRDLIFQAVRSLDTILYSTIDKIATNLQQYDDRDNLLELINKILVDFKVELQALIGNISRKQKIPSFVGDADDSIDYESLKDPRLKKFMIAMQWLAKKGIAYFEDMHAGNVLYRPSTDDIVAADVGNWDF